MFESNVLLKSDTAHCPADAWCRVDFLSHDFTDFIKGDRFDDADQIIRTGYAINLDSML